MAKIDQEFRNLIQPQLCRQVQGCVAAVEEIGILTESGIVFHYASHEGEVVEVDGAAEADGGVDPESHTQSFSLADMSQERERERDRGGRGKG